MLEGSGERQRRALGKGSSSFRVQQETQRGLAVVEVCAAPQEDVKAAGMSFDALKRHFLVRVDWPAACQPEMEQIEFMFAKLVTLRAERHAGPQATYLVQLPQELLDAYATSQVLGNIWLRLDLSPRHWVAVSRDEEPAGEDREAFIRRHTELQGLADAFFVSGLREVDTLVATLMASRGLGHYSSTVVPFGGHHRLTVKDN